MNRGRFFRTTLPAMLVLLAAVLIAAGCGSGDDKIAEARKQGYDEGVKAEQAKWSNEKLKLAQTYIKEQEDSQEYVADLLQGDITGITVGAINVDDAAGKAQVGITANFTDGSTVDGVIDLVKIDSYWYILQITHVPPSS